MVHVAVLEANSCRLDLASRCVGTSDGIAVSVSEVWELAAPRIRDYAIEKWSQLRMRGSRAPGRSCRCAAGASHFLRHLQPHLSPSRQKAVKDICLSSADVCLEDVKSQRAARLRPRVASLGRVEKPPKLSGAARIPNSKLNRIKYQKRNFPLKTCHFGNFARIRCRRLGVSD